MSKMKNTDEFGRRMKSYEEAFFSKRLDVKLPVYARIDGRAFRTFTRDMHKPFDMRMGILMGETTKYLVQATHARIGYTQSDEISLVWLAENDNSDIFFSGKIQKMTSILSSMTTARFMYGIHDFSGSHSIAYEWLKKLPNFDCRVFQLPSKMEAANTFLWRAMDARKNAISMAAQAHFSPKELHGKDQGDMLAMLATIGIDFEYKYSAADRMGSFFRTRAIERNLTDEELARIPEDKRPTGPVLRNEVYRIDMPPFNKVLNRIEVIFDGAEPKV